METLLLPEQIMFRIPMPVDHCDMNTHNTPYQNVCRKCWQPCFKKEDLIFFPKLWKWHLDSVEDRFVVRMRLYFLLELKIKIETNWANTNRIKGGPGLLSLVAQDNIDWSYTH